MKNVILFPGTDAVENPLFRAQALSIKGVKELVIKTEEIIQDLFGERIELLPYMKSANDPSVRGFRKLLFCSLATQVAIYNNYTAINGKPDSIIGLSLGDVPRSVVSGLVSYEEGVRNLYLFASMYALAEPGLCVHLKLDQPFDYMKETLKLKEYGISKSVIQNESFGLVAGPMDNMKYWLSMVAMKEDLKYRIMYPFPLHTNLMKPVADKLRPFIEKACRIEEKHTDIFSTVYGRMLTTKEDIINDCTLNIAEALDFPFAINALINHYDKEEINFVNIGPSNSLVKFLNHMNIETNYYITDWYERILMKAA